MTSWHHLLKSNNSFHPLRRTLLVYESYELSADLLDLIELSSSLFQIRIAATAPLNETPDLILGISYHPFRMPTRLRTSKLR